jgi:nicotinate-nucleotide adenylyltransferase
MDRVGILGGTFDPIHLGHLIVGEVARERLGLDRLIFMPAGSPRLKEQEPSATPQQRLAMAQLAVDDNPRFEVGGHEVERPGLTYTVDTLEELRRGLEDDAQLYFIVGMDALEQFDRWKEPERLLDLCSLVVVNRVGHQRVDVNDFVGRYPQAGPGLTLLNAPRVEISSTEIRRRVSEGQSVKYLTPAPVEEYIRREGLYQ